MGELAGGGPPPPLPIYRKRGRQMFLADCFLQIILLKRSACINDSIFVYGCNFKVLPCPDVLVFVITGF